MLYRQVFARNLQVLTEQNVEFTMQNITFALGVGCVFCHDVNDLSLDTTPKKAKARMMLEMVRDINASFGDGIVVGENRVGKSNLVYALQLILDPTLSDSARQLGLLDLWDGLEGPSVDDKIVVSVEIKDFEDDMDVLRVLTDYRLKASAMSLIKAGLSLVAG